MKKEIKAARSMAHEVISLDPDQKWDLSAVQSLIAPFKQLFSSLTSEDCEELAAMIMDDLSINTEEALEIVGEDVKPWLHAAKSRIEELNDWELWTRYRKYLLKKNPNFPVSELDRATDKILDHCMDPKVAGAWDRRGLVVGHVQSGKTANYAGLINKATDAGYKFVVVLAGMYNDLRRQTQIRIDEGFVGRESKEKPNGIRSTKIGVGNVKIPVNQEIHSYTTADDKGDFKSNHRLNISLKGELAKVLVIKKNKSILENLIVWLDGFAEELDGKRVIPNIPLLVIDDEADNASVNSGTEVDVKTINRLIRVLLGLFAQNSYIGYTATPYANLFIPGSWNETLETHVKERKFLVGEDLFPRDFIINIPAPSNYIGATKVFGIDGEMSGRVEGLDIVRVVRDRDPLLPAKINKTNEGERPESLPGSLKLAIKSFVLTSAIRILRGQGSDHSSMLVHVALRVSWIDRVARLVFEELNHLRNAIRYQDQAVLSELEHLFNEDFVPTTESVKLNMGYSDSKVQVHQWADVKEKLVDAVMKIQVRSVHGQKKVAGLEFPEIEDLNYDKYEEGLSVIAVGGNKLARGLTLEGLSISYYLRTSKMYDSLMQMGRWFGYRPGYVDLCRLFTTGELIEWFQHVAVATEEMRQDFDELSRKRMRPKDFRLKVRTHPGMMRITALGKMREHEKIRVAFSGRLVQTYAFSAKDQASNAEAFDRLIHHYSVQRREVQPNEIGNSRHLVFDGVEPQGVLDFLGAYKGVDIDYDPEIGYINRQLESDQLTKWTVVVFDTKGGSLVHKCQTGAHTYEFGVAGRSLQMRETERVLYVGGGKNAILFKDQLVVDLPSVTKDSKMDEIKAARTAKAQPLLVIIPLTNREGPVDGFDNDVPLVGFGIHFPVIDGEKHYEYAARPIPEFMEELQTSDELEEDE